MKSVPVLVWALCLASPAGANDTFQNDIFGYNGETLEITFLGHGTLMIQFTGRVIHVDPVSREADYSLLPDADLILITHHHGDHLDVGAIQHIRAEKTIIIADETSAAQVAGSVVMKNGDVRSEIGIQIEAMPAYNTTAGRSRFHPRGRDNGYILTIGDMRVYIAGDTEFIPEIKRLREIDIAFLPMNQPYTMTPQQAAGAAKAFRPRILYPYHFGNTDVSELTSLLEDETDIEVRIRNME